MRRSSLAAVTDEETVIVALGENRTYEYLRENPHAVFTIVESGETIADWKGSGSTCG